MPVSAKRFTAATIRSRIGRSKRATSLRARWVHSARQLTPRPAASGVLPRAKSRGQQHGPGALLRDQPIPRHSAVHHRQVSAPGSWKRDPRPYLLVLPFINTVIFAEGACEARSRSEKEAMSGHPRRRATKRSTTTSLRPKGCGVAPPSSSLLLLADIPYRLVGAP